MLMRCSNNLSLIFPPEPNTHLCNTATALLLLPYLLHQDTRRNYWHVTRHCLVIAHSLLDATYMWAFWELNCQTSYFDRWQQRWWLCLKMIPLLILICFLCQLTVGSDPWWMSKVMLCCGKMNQHFMPAQYADINTIYGFWDGNSRTAVCRRCFLNRHIPNRQVFSDTHCRIINLICPVYYLLQITAWLDYFARGATQRCGYSGLSGAEPSYTGKVLHSQALPHRKSFLYCWGLTPAAVCIDIKN
jgi:hypothetical protein